MTTDEAKNELFSFHYLSYSTWI